MREFFGFIGIFVVGILVVMIQLRAYHEGELRNLYRLKTQWIEAKTQEEKTTLQLAARHECEAVDLTQLPRDLISFCHQIKKSDD